MNVDDALHLRDPSGDPAGLAGPQKHVSVPNRVIRCEFPHVVQYLILTVTSLTLSTRSDEMHALLALPFGRSGTVRGRDDRKIGGKQQKQGRHPLRHHHSPETWDGIPVTTQNIPYDSIFEPLRRVG